MTMFSEIFQYIYSKFCMRCFSKLYRKILYNLWEYLDKLLKYHNTEYQSMLKNI